MYKRQTEHRAAQAIVRIIGKRNRLLIVFHHVDLRHRSKELFEVRRVVTGDTGQDSGFKEVAFPRHRFAAQMQLSLIHILISTCWISC